MATIAIEKKITPSLMNKTLKELFSDYPSGKVIFLADEVKKEEVKAYSDDSTSRKKAMKDLKDGKTFSAKSVAKELGITR